MTRKTNTKTAAIKEDAERLKSWATILKGLEAIQKAYLEVSAEYEALTQKGVNAGTARTMRDGLGETLRPLETELWRNAKSSGLSMPKFISI